MSEEDTILDYNKIIWQTFGVGVTASVIILYSVINKESMIPEDFKVLTLSLGFAILVYSFLLTLGYGTQKGKLMKMKEKNLSKILAEMWYPRVRWMGEAILIFIGFCYFVAFYEISNTPTLTTLIPHIIDLLVKLHIPTLIYISLPPVMILMIAIILCIIANILAKKKAKIAKEKEKIAKEKAKEDWEGFVDWLRDYFGFEKIDPSSENVREKTRDKPKNNS